MAIEKAINNSSPKIIDLSQKRLDELRSIYGDSNIEYIVSSDSSIEEALKNSDLVVGTVYVIGKQTQKL